MAGAAAATDSRIVEVARPGGLHGPAEPAHREHQPHRGRRGLPQPPATSRRWSPQFSALLDRVLEATASASDDASALSARSEILTTALEQALRGPGAAARWQELLGFSGRPFSEVERVPPGKLLPWLCCQIDQAAALRLNTFGRLLPPTGQALPEEPELAALAESMKEGDATPSMGGVPAGFVFLGQFVDHDITLDAITSLAQTEVDVDQVLNLRSPSLDLDNVYGDGPDGSPYLYDQNGPPGRLLVGNGGADLPRNVQGRALIGDPRNDENLFVSQLHLQFLLFHDGVLRQIAGGGVDEAWGRTPDESDFEFARRLVRWHYQWVVVNEYLPTIIAQAPLMAAHAITGVRQGVADPAPLAPPFRQAAKRLAKLRGTDCCGRPRLGPLMPVEFSGAAFRFAHSQVPGRFDINAANLDVPLFSPRPPAPGAFGPADHEVDWSRFFSIGGSAPQTARPIDTQLTAQLFALPFAPEAPSLALRNLVRSARVYALPTGQEAADALGLATAMTPAATTMAEAAGLAGRAPLWFFCLGEAEANGGQLGPLGGLIVAHTLLQMLRRDPRSYVHAPMPWQPVLGPVAPEQFGMADLLTRAADERALI